MHGIIPTTNFSFLTAPVTISRSLNAQRYTSEQTSRWNTAPCENIGENYNVNPPVNTINLDQSLIPQEGNQIGPKFTW